MLFNPTLYGITAVVTAWVLLRVLSVVNASEKEMKWTYYGLISVAGIGSALICLGAAGIAVWTGELFPLLADMLLLPAFTILLYGTVHQLAFVAWFITIASGVTWCVEETIDNAFSTDPIHDGMLRLFFNPFTRILIVTSVFIQLAALCQTRRIKLYEIDRNHTQTNSESTPQSN